MSAKIIPFPQPGQFPSRAEVEAGLKQSHSNILMAATPERQAYIHGFIAGFAKAAATPA